MLKEVKGMEKVYRVKNVHGYCYYIVTDNEEELAKFCAIKDKAGCIISSVSEMQPNGKTPRVSVCSMPAYKEAKKKIMPWDRFQETMTFKAADVFEISDIDGNEISPENVKSYWLVVDYHLKSGFLNIVIYND